MNCEKARELIIEVLYDELPLESVPELERHLTECMGCFKYKEEIQTIIECLDRDEESYAPVDLAALHDAVDKRRHRVWETLRRRWPAWVAVGACATMLCMFMLFVSQIQYEGNALTITFNGQKTEPLADRTERILAAYRQDQVNFQKQMSAELRASVAALSQIIDDYESQRDRQLAGAFQQMQIQQHQMLVAIQGQLETLAVQTEDATTRSYLTMAAVAGLVESQ